MSFQATASIDGKLTPLAEACVPVLDRGFLYGDSIYEVFRTYKGVPLYFDEHWQRFENSARLIRLELGDIRQTLTDDIRQAVAASRAGETHTDVYVRYIVTRGEGALDLLPRHGLTPRRIVIVREVPQWNPMHYTRGATLAIVSVRRNPHDALDPNIKGGNYLNNVLGVIEADALGADDCLMLNEAGLITEASNSNVFFLIFAKGSEPARADEGGDPRCLRDCRHPNAGIGNRSRRCLEGDRMFRHQRDAGSHADRGTDS